MKARSSSSDISPGCFSIRDTRGASALDAGEEVVTVGDVPVVGSAFICKTLDVEVDDGLDFAVREDRFDKHDVVAGGVSVDTDLCVFVVFEGEVGVCHRMV